MHRLLVDQSVLSCLVAVAEHALTDLETGLADGTYEEDNIGGWESEAIAAALNDADIILEAAA